MWRGKGGMITGKKEKEFKFSHRLLSFLGISFFDFFGFLNFFEFYSLAKSGRRGSATS